MTRRAPGPQVIVFVAITVLLDVMGFGIIMPVLPRLLVDTVDKKADYKDVATVQKYLQDEAGAGVKLHKYDPQKGNQYLILLDHQIY